MGFFLTAFFFIYSLLHFYLFARARTALGFGTAVTIFLALFLVVMITAPVATHLSENAGFGLLARVMAYVGYTWMALLFLLFCTLLATDLYRLSVRLAGSAAGGTLSWLALSARSCFLLSLASAAIIGLYGWFEAGAIRVETIAIATSKIPVQASPLRIVQISDVHLGLTACGNRLKKIMRLVREAHPDILVSTGDLVDGKMDGRKEMAGMLRAVTPRYGKFAITGNHEFYAGLDQALAFTNEAGFHVLRGEAVTIGDVINIVGVDDPSRSGYGSSDTGEKAVLSSASKGKFTLFLKHRPVVDAESVGLFDLQLSGHVHDGQIFPFRLITRLFYPFIAGLYPLRPGSALYVSRGSGTWGPPIRFLAPPEVTVIELFRPPSR
jgi:predicted MPP superfamily phosphohydrolase